MRFVRRLRVMVVKRAFDLDGERLDRRLGLDTRGIAEPTSLTVPIGDPAEGFTYVATSPRLARWWLAALPRDVSDYTFVDMGSGKGRVLFMASARGFRRVLGVEFAEELHAAAMANARAARERGIEVEPILGDAALFKFPPEPLVVHFNNPFSESVMGLVLTNLTASYKTSPRPIVVVYQQLTIEDEPHRTRNIELVSKCSFLTGHRLTPRGLVDRRLFRSHTVVVFSSAEVSLGR